MSQIRRRRLKTTAIENLELRSLLTSGPNEISALYQAGFNPTSLHLNGSANLSGATLRLTDGGSNQSGSAFHTTPIDVSRAFTTSFQFQITPHGTDPLGSGFTFDIQNLGNVSNAAMNSATQADALGLTQGKHLAIKFDTLNDNPNNWAGGEFSNNSTGLYLNTNVPSMGDATEIDLPRSVIDLHSGHIFQVTIHYNPPQAGASGSLIETITDTKTGGTWSHTYVNLDIQAMLALNDVTGQYAYAGFTASSGSPGFSPAAGATFRSTQDILNWSWQDGTELAREPYAATFSLSTPQTTAAAVFDARNQLVRTLWQANPLPAGNYQIFWDGLDQAGNAVNTAINPGPYTFQVVENQAVYTASHVIANTTANPTSPFASLSALGMFGVATSSDGSKIWTVGLAGDTAGGGFIKELDAAGNVNVQASIAMNNYHIGSAVAADSGYLYVAVQLWNYSGSHGVIRINLANYDQATGFTDWGHINADGSQNTNDANWHYLQVLSGLTTNLFLNALSGIAVSNYNDPAHGWLYVTDLVNNEVHIYDKVTGDQVGVPIQVNHPTGIAVDPAGNVWVAHGTDTTANQISVYSASGTLLRDVTEAVGLNDVASLSIVNGKLYIADRGAGKVQVYSISGTSLSNGSSPQTIGRPASFGNDDGKSMFWDLRGATADANGNLYTVQRTPGPNPSGFVGSQVEKWSSTGTPIWVKGGYEYTSVAGAYSASDPTILYSTTLHRYRILDPVAGTWEYLGSAAYPGISTNKWSGLPDSATTSPLKFLQIGGTEFLTYVRADRVLFYRINPDGSVHPATILGTLGLSNGDLWTWNDVVGDGVPLDAQIKDSGVQLGIARMTIDDQGNLWYLSAPGWTEIYKVPLQGVDARGNPVYDWTRSIHVLSTPHPVNFVVGTDGVYVQEVNVAVGPLSSGSFVGGYSIGGSNSITKYDLQGNRSWTIPLPTYSVGMAALPGGGLIVGSHTNSAIYHIASDGQVIGYAVPPTFGDYLDAGGGSIIVNRNSIDGIVDVFTEGVGYSACPWYRIDDHAANILLQGTVQPGVIAPLTTSTPTSGSGGSISTPTLLPSTDSGIVGDYTTNVRKPILIGTAPGAASVQIVTPSGVILGSGVVDDLGTYSVAFNANLADGSQTVMIGVIELDGTTGPFSKPITLTIDTTPPSLPPAPALLPEDDTGTPGDGATTIPQPRLTGSAEPGSTIQLLDATGTVIGTAPVAADGSYVVAPAGPLATGRQTLRVNDRDAAGNVSRNSSSFRITIVPQPATPTSLALNPADDTGTLGDGITSTRQPRLMGSATAGTTVQILDSSGTVIGSTRASSSGRFTIRPASPLVDGSYTFVAQSLDNYGNTSAQSDPFSLKIVNTPGIRTRGGGATLVTLD